MADIYPERPPNRTPMAEIKVREALSRLPKPWTIFHSVAWQSYRGGRQADGEADFVAVHPGYGLVLIEVKGGAISVVNGHWYSEDSRTHERHHIKDPFKQATDSKYALMRYLDQLQPPLKGVPIAHAVALPGGSVEGNLSPSAPRAIIWDGADLTQPLQAMDRVLAHWNPKGNLSKQQMAQVKNLLAPTTRIRPHLRDVLAESAQRLIELTDGQVRALSGLRRNRRALIYGGAGTGKTVLATERAKTLGQEGFRVLLTCYNRPLGEFLERELDEAENVSAMSFHSLCAREIKRAGLDMPRHPTDSWWSEVAPELLLKAVEINGTIFDATVVDEGQDFSPIWFESLFMLMSDPDGSPFYVFADTQQAIYRRDWKAPGAWPAFDLDINCRNTLPIATRVSKLFNMEPASLGATGVAPLFLVADSADEVMDAIAFLVRRFVKEEMLEPSQIAVISESRPFIDELRLMKVAGKRFGERGGDWITAETLHRFKGMESEVVIVALKGIDLDHAASRGLAYVALSRARSFLVVVGSRKQARALDWPKSMVKQPA